MSRGAEGPAIEAALRAARLQLKKTMAEVEEAFLRDRSSHGFDSFSRMIAKMCAEGYRTAAFEAGRRYDALKSTAQKRSGDYRTAIGLLVPEVLSIFDDYDGSGTLYPKPTETRSALARELEEIADDLSLDMAVGAFRVSQNLRTGPTTITFRGNATNVAIATDSSIVRIDGDQTVSTGITTADLLAALSEIEEALLSSQLSSDERETALDGLVLARHELQKPSPDAGRLKRFFSGAGDVAVKVGTSAAGGVIARFIALGLGAG